MGSIIHVPHRPSSWAGMTSCDGLDAKHYAELNKQKKKRMQEEEKKEQERQEMIALAKKENKLRKKRNPDLIRTSQLICTNRETQDEYKKRFFQKYPDYPQDEFKKFVNMYYAVINKKKLIMVAPHSETIFLLRHLKTKNNDLALQFIKQLYTYAQTSPLKKGIKIECNKVLAENGKKELFILPTRNKK